jgi:8-oxo-dGTP pyrophosphatase MutT (NUDIX family)
LKEKKKEERKEKFKMGASILPVTVINGTVYFLFGKERAIDDNPGWSDFGGGTDNKESFLETAIREAEEETTGFLGNQTTLRQMLQKHGYLHVDYTTPKYGTYRCHIFPMTYDPYLTTYYNNNQRFLQHRLDAKVIANTKIFEKTEMKWFSFNDIIKHKKSFRSFYIHIIDEILQRRKEITAFVMSTTGSKRKRRTARIRRTKKNRNK